MEKKQDKKQLEEIKKQAYQELSTALALAKDPVLIGDFLECLLTPTELQDVTTRWALVREIDDGITQREISKNLGLSLCKITRGSRELKKDDSPFKKMIDVYLAGQAKK
ncbi:MAG TPA: transcriptional regulator [Treponema sp.]|nr:transcriptional regulator [Treponema sp.]